MKNDSLPTQLHKTQVLVVGGGGAGVRAAIAAAESGMDVKFVVNGPLFATGSTFYELSPGWGIMSARDADDVQAFYDDIMSAADGCVDPRLVRVMCERSSEAVESLKSWGISFWSLEELGMTPCFGNAPRGNLLKDLNQCKQRLSEKVGSLPGIRIAQDVSVATILVRDGVCSGAVGLDANGTLHVFQAGATVLACGGAQNLYRYAYRNGCNNGAAYAMAARHGARVVNLEFVQFINATLAPRVGINYYQFLFRTLPRVLNANGEPFLERYLPEGLTVDDLLRLRATHGPFSVADDAQYFDLAIALESERTQKMGAVILPDADKLRDAIYKPWKHCLNEAGHSLDEPMTVYPHSHAFNGGVLMSPDMATDIPGLFVCGESAGGCHGANRIGGNSMLGTQVFGALAGNAAASFAQRDVPEISAEEAVDMLRRECEAVFSEGDEDSEDAGSVMSEVQDVMQRSGFLTRDDPGLRDGLERLEQRCRSFAPARRLGTEGARQALEAFNALCSARLILSAMLERRESRGGHHRTDYPSRNEALTKMQAVTFAGGDVSVSLVG